MLVLLSYYQLQILENYQELETKQVQIMFLLL